MESMSDVNTKAALALSLRLLGSCMASSTSSAEKGIFCNLKPGQLTIVEQVLLSTFPHVLLITFVLACPHRI
jgi:hypothetical protein